MKFIKKNIEEYKKLTSRGDCLYSSIGFKDLNIRGSLVSSVRLSSRPNNITNYIVQHSDLEKLLLKFMLKNMDKFIEFLETEALENLQDELIKLNAKQKEIEKLINNK